MRWLERAILLFQSSGWLATLLPQSVHHYRCPNISGTEKKECLFSLRRNQQTVHLHLSNDWDDSPQLLVHHEPEDSHHGRPAVVELDGALLQLGLLVKLVPPGLERPVAKVTREFVAESRHVLHDGDLEEPDEGEDLKRALDGDGVRAVDGGPAVGEGVEGVSRVVDVSREVDTGAGDDVAQEGKLGDASVLDLDVTEAVESLLVGAVQKAEGVEESDGRLGSELTLESPEGCGGLASLYRGEGSGGGGEGGEDGKLHHDVVWFVRREKCKIRKAFRGRKIHLKLLCFLPG